MLSAFRAIARSSTAAPVVRSLESGSRQIRCSSSGYVFNRQTKRAQKNRAMADPEFREYEMLKDKVAWLLSDRLEDIDREFGLGLDLGCGRGYLGKHVDDGLVNRMVQCDLSENALQKFDGDARDRDLRVSCDEEFLPFGDNTFDVVTSNLSLHWVNDLPGVLKQVNNTLKPDGVFIATMFGGETLVELRCSLQLAELERKGDVDEVTIGYPSIYEVMDDVRGMGESNAAAQRTHYLPREVMAAAGAIYEGMYGDPEQEGVPATYQVIHLVGWKPDPSQPKSAKRGSATASLKDLGIDVDKLKVD